MAVLLPKTYPGVWPSRHVVPTRTLPTPEHPFVTDRAKIRPDPRPYIRHHVTRLEILLPPLAPL